MKKRVVIAEDDPSIVLSLEFLMKEEGLEPFIAANGSDAINLCREHAPELLVLDVMLPVVDGFEVCRSIREDTALRGTRILMLTARGRDHEVTRGLELGANAYVTKPFATRELLETVRTLLRDRAA